MTAVRVSEGKTVSLARARGVRGWFGYAVDIDDRPVSLVVTDVADVKAGSLRATGGRQRFPVQLVGAAHGESSDDPARSIDGEERSGTIVSNDPHPIVTSRVRCNTTG